jgi:hypothetical protein
MKLPRFGKFLDQLRAAGVETKNAHGFWGGVTPEGEIVVTSWIDNHDGNGRFAISRPLTNHGSLKTAWEIGNIHVGAEVRMILVRQRGNIPLGEDGRTVKDAALLAGKWRVVKMVADREAHVEELPSFDVVPSPSPVHAAQIA